MKILIVIPGMGPGGAERACSNLVNDLAGNGHEISLLFFVGEKPFYHIDERVRLIPLNVSMNRTSSLTFTLSMGQYFLHCLQKVKKAVRESDPDILLSIQWQADIIAYYAKGHLCWAVRSITDPERYSAVLKSILLKIYRKCDLLICQTKAICDRYSGIPQKKKKILFNAVDLSLFPEPAEEKDLTFVSVGRLHPVKNFPLLIKAFHAAAAQYQGDCRLVIYGEGPLRTSLQQLINDLHADNITLPGTDEDILHTIRNAAALVISSDYEGFSNVLLEGVIMGLPVISTDHPSGDARQLAEKGYVRTVPVNDEEKMAEAILEYLQNPELRQRQREFNRHFRDTEEIRKSCLLWEKTLLETVIRYHIGSESV